jgi:hypothetical protein
MAYSQSEFPGIDREYTEGCPVLTQPGVRCVFFCDGLREMPVPAVMSNVPYFWMRVER